MPDSTKPRVAVSYSWKEERDGANKGSVNAFCSQLTGAAINVVRDKDEVKHGESLSNFMQSIGASDFLCVFLSDSYLHSPNCMYELLIAWQRSKDNPTEFRKRIKVWVMDGVSGIEKVVNRIKYITYWGNQSSEIEAVIKEHATDGLGLIRTTSIYFLAELRMS